MKNALVLGASGGMGSATVMELIKRGIKVTAFARSNSKLEKLFAAYPEVTIYSGDVFNKRDLEEAVKHKNIIFHAINLPYPEWESKLVPLTENIIRAAKIAKAKLAVVDNIYAYGKSESLVVETQVKQPHTKKGKLRLQAEKCIKNSGVSYVITHFPDFYGPHAENTQLNYTLRSVVQNKRAWFIGNPAIAREHLFTLDGAKALVELSLRDDAYGQNWNIPASHPISGNELITQIRELTEFKKKVSIVTTNLLRFLGIYDRQMREFVEMQYINEQPVILSGEKYTKWIGPLPKTPYKEGLKITIEAYKNQFYSKM